jgi:hypothetical protein
MNFDRRHLISARYLTCWRDEREIRDVDCAWDGFNDARAISNNAAAA